MSYLMNCWYAFAWSNEIGESLFTRTVLNKRIVAFRRRDGSPAALLDRCPHRFAPLSMGHKEDDSIRCHYHGLGFNGEGICVYSPFSDKPPANGHAYSFPLAEKNQMVWIWPGDPARADPALIQDFCFHDPEPGRDSWTAAGYVLMRTNYEVETDNLMDLSHIEILHAGSFGGRGYIYAGQHQLHDKGTEIDSNWWIPSVPFVDPASGEAAAKTIDHYIDMRWQAPANMILHTGFIPIDQYREHADGDRAGVPGQWISHILTPETDATTHYFWCAARPTDLTSGMTAEVAKTLLKRAFEDEDKPMLEAVQDNMDDEFWKMQPMVIASDAGGIRVRRRLAKMISDEMASSVKHQS